MLITWVQDFYDYHYGHDERGDDHNSFGGGSYIPPQPKGFYDLTGDLIPDLDDVAKKFDWDVKDFRHWGSMGPGFSGTDIGPPARKFSSLGKDPRASRLPPSFHEDFEEEQEDLLFRDPYPRQPQRPNVYSNLR